MSRISIALLAVPVLTGAMAVMSVDGTASAAPRASVTEAAKVAISPEAADDLTFAREEERMARDLYQYFSDTYDGARPFSNIVRSEARHFARIGTLLQRYSLDDPSAGKPAGTYAVPAIQELYDKWKAQGDKSLQDAFAVGVELETRDIADLEEMLAADPPADVRTTYENLLAGSRNHLAAYTRAADGQLGQGQGQGQGQGHGHGQGQGQGRQGQGRRLFGSGDPAQCDGQVRGRAEQGQGLQGRGGQGQG